MSYLALQNGRASKNVMNDQTLLQSNCSAIMN